MVNGYNNCKLSWEEFKISSISGMNIENLKKAIDNLNTQKNNITDIFTDIHACLEQLDDMKGRLDDCNIGQNISRRKNCVTSIITKIDRLSQEFQNLKKA